MSERGRLERNEIVGERKRERDSNSKKLHVLRPTNLLPSF